MVWSDVCAMITAVSNGDTCRICMLRRQQAALNLVLRSAFLCSVVQGALFIVLSTRQLFVSCALRSAILNVLSCVHSTVAAAGCSGGCYRRVSCHTDIGSSGHLGHCSASGGSSYIWQRPGAVPPAAAAAAAGGPMWRRSSTM
ncbi:hypothetical protein COO60DRAFT_545089 [Scenedesmus sp. NREL 46B-D3]|nr:hypothetical protein COO60DRAFT_545089 [Scenedesmus sp. NREL 46B-D3]